MKQEKDKPDAVFNMAIDTLQRCGEILREIKMISSSPFLPKEEIQDLKISLTKQFFFQISPLLSEGVVEEYKEEILNLKQTQTKTFIKGMFGVPEYKGFQFVYDPALEKKLDELLIKLQRELQKEGKYMMPSRSDPRYSWGQGE